MSTVRITQARPPAGDVVVLVHGLAAPKLVLRPLERRLNRSGFQAVNWGYPSVWGGIDGHASRLVELLDQLETSLEIRSLANWDSTRLLRLLGIIK